MHWPAAIWQPLAALPRWGRRWERPPRRRRLSYYLQEFTARLEVKRNRLDVHLPDWVYIVVAVLSVVLAVVLLMFALAPRT
jgi:hypothetical protein